MRGNPEVKARTEAIKRQLAEQKDRDEKQASLPTPKNPIGIRSGVGCAHKYIFLRQIEERDGGFRPESTFFDVFFCEKCLTTSRVKVSHTVSYGDGRRVVVNDI